MITEINDRCNSEIGHSLEQLYYLWFYCFTGYVSRVEASVNEANVQ